MFIEKKKLSLYLTNTELDCLCKNFGPGPQGSTYWYSGWYGKRKSRKETLSRRTGQVLFCHLHLSPHPWHCIGLLLLIFMRSHHKERKVVHMWFIFFGSFLLWLACFWWMSCNSIQYVLSSLILSCNYQLLNILTERRKNFPLLLFNSGFLNCWIRLVS